MGMCSVWFAPESNSGPGRTRPLNASASGSRMRAVVDFSCERSVAFPQTKLSDR